MTLDLGPGRNVQPHFSQPVVRYDHRKEACVQVVGDVRKLPFRSETFDVVYASHVLEHFHSRESLMIVQEWVRVVKIGGELQLFVPNLEWIALQIQAGICDEFVMNALYGRQEYPSDVHRTGFTPARLEEVLNQFDLELETRTFRNSICVWARKVNHLEKHSNGHRVLPESGEVATIVAKHEMGRDARRSPAYFRGSQSV